MKDSGVDKDLEPLNEAIAKMVALQNDAHPGLATWNDCMRNALLDIYRHAGLLTGQIRPQTKKSLSPLDRMIDKACGRKP